MDWIRKLTHQSHLGKDHEIILLALGKLGRSGSWNIYIEKDPFIFQVVPELELPYTHPRTGDIHEQQSLLD
jgi:hypothetical protein